MNFDLCFYILLTNESRLWYKALMLRTLGFGVLFLMQGLDLFSQTIPDQGFFEDGTGSLEVKTFCLPLDNVGTAVNCYLAWLPESGQAVVVDPGAPAGEILEFVRARHLKVQAVLNTHGHYDHCAGDSFLAAKLSVPVYIHKYDSEKVFEIAGVNCPIIFLPKDQRLILDGLEIEVIATPGHTSGSVCLRIGETLFSGDTLFAGAVGKAEGNSKSMRRANLQLEIQSIRKLLLPLSPSTRVFPGHGPATTIGAEKVFNPYLIQ